MKCEIYGPDKKRKAHTESEKCIPDEQTLKQLKAAGYTILIDGKRWKPGNALNDELKGRRK